MFCIHSWDVPCHPCFQKKVRVSHLWMPSFTSPFTHCFTLLDLCPVIVSILLWRPEFTAVLSSQLQLSHLDPSLSPLCVTAQTNSGVPGKFTWGKQHCLFFKIHLFCPYFFSGIKGAQSRDLLTQQRNHRAFPRVHLRCHHCGILKHLSSVWVYVRVCVCVLRCRSGKSCFPAHL